MNGWMRGDEMDGGHMCVRAGVLEVDGWKIMVVYDGIEDEDGVGAFFVDHAIVSTLVPVRQAQSGYGHTGSGDGFPSSSH